MIFIHKRLRMVIVKMVKLLLFLIIISINRNTISYILYVTDTAKHQNIQNHFLSSLAEGVIK